MRLVDAERVACFLVIAYLQWQVFLVGVDLTREAGRVFTLPGVRTGLWLFAGRAVDLSDAQWRDFRSSLAPLASAMVVIVLLSRLVRSVLPRARPVFYAAVGVAFIGALHGACALFVLALVLANFLLSARVSGRPRGMLVLWVCNCSVLVAVRVLDGVPFATLSPSLAFLDSHRGMLRWHIHYNLLVLRMLSFGCDLHWARQGRQPAHRRPLGGDGTASTARDAAGDLAEADGGLSASGTVDLKARTEASLPLPRYSLTMYLAYLLYPPLYVAGPILSFNAFASQLVAPGRTGGKQVVLYALRWLAAWLLLEGMTHTLHCNTLAKHRLWDALRGAGVTLGPLHFAVTGYWVLVFMWLKFLVIWRFFRLVALADGVVAPENMTRCVCNNYDIDGFWRGWHSSYNQWLVRYLYVPLGGARWRAANVWVIFTFVALWHDLEWRLLGWAWIMALAMAPEMAVKRLGRTQVVRRWESTALHRHAAAAAATANITVLMVGNLVGFVVGVDGIVPLLREIVFEQPRFSLAVLATFFAAAHLMFAVREWEQRQRLGGSTAHTAFSGSGGNSSGGGGGGVVGARSRRITETPVELTSCAPPPGTLLRPRKASA